MSWYCSQPVYSGSQSDLLSLYYNVIVKIHNGNLLFAKKCLLFLTYSKNIRVQQAIENKEIKNVIKMCTTIINMYIMILYIWYDFTNFFCDNFQLLTTYFGHIIISLLQLVFRTLLHLHHFHPHRHLQYFLLLFLLQDLHYLTPRIMLKE